MKPASCAMTYQLTSSYSVIVNLKPCRMAASALEEPSRPSAQPAAHLQMRLACISSDADGKQRTLLRIIPPRTGISE